MSYPVAAVRGKGSANVRYWQKIKNIFGSSLIQYLPLYEASGNPFDISGGNRNGANTNVTMGQAGIGDGQTSALYPGNARTTLNGGNQLVGVFSGDEGSISLWAQMDVAQVADNQYHTFFRLQSTTSDQIWLMKTNTNNIYGVRTGNGDAKQAFTPYTGTGFFHVGFTWKNGGNAILYLNGYKYTPVAGCQVWTGNPNATSFLGCYDGAQYYHYGKLANYALGTRQLTDAEMIQLATVNRVPGWITVIGDSISVDGVTKWPNQTFSGRSVTYGISRAVSGAVVIHDGVNTDMADEVTAAASDICNIIIVLLGTNDTDTTDASFRVNYQAGLTTLKANHPSARIYCLGILNRFDGVTRRDTQNPLIATAAANVGATYVNTDGWIAQADTSDNLHPNDAGHDKITTQVLAAIGA